MDDVERRRILEGARAFFAESIAERHAENTRRCGELRSFSINPFTVHYLAAFAFGDDTAESLAKALAYPRVLGTSIATTFGNNVQTFCHDVMSAYASTTSGIDVEFIDATDHRRKYCQLKAGPQTINKDDVRTIKDHFRSLTNLARTNHLQDFNPMTDCVVGILYGTHDEISANYRSIEKSYPVYVGQEFWHRLTGDDDFYSCLIEAFSSCAADYRESRLLDDVIRSLADDIARHPEILSCD